LHSRPIERRLGFTGWAWEGVDRLPLEVADQNHWYPAWSPDGSRIAFESIVTADQHEIWIINSDG
jgi:Tol biopolymer transport system component